MLATRMRMSSGGGGGKPFGPDPSSIAGVTFFNGDASQGMIVYKTPGTYTLPVLSDVDIDGLIVAGGGGSGYYFYSGSGGAGGLLELTEHHLSKGNITITVGVGGVGGLNVAFNNDGRRGKSGTNSSIGTTIAIGGGGGGGYSASTASVGTGRNGGSGGGAGTREGSIKDPRPPPGTGVAGPPRQGYNGGTNYIMEGGGAGGGAGSSGWGTDLRNGGIGKAVYGYTYAIGGRGYWYRAYNNLGYGSGGDTPINNSGNGGGQVFHGSRAGSTGIVIIRWGVYDKNYNPTNNAVT